MNCAHAIANWLLRAAEQIVFVDSGDGSGQIETI
jgi:hypothetical protein